MINVHPADHNLKIFSLLHKAANFHWWEAWTMGGFVGIFCMKKWPTVNQFTHRWIHINNIIFFLIWQIYGKITEKHSNLMLNAVDWSVPLFCIHQTKVFTSSLLYCSVWRGDRQGLSAKVRFILSSHTLNLVNDLPHNNCTNKPFWPCMPVSVRAWPDRARLTRTLAYTAQCVCWGL